MSSPASPSPAARPVPSSNPVFRSILKYGLLIALAIAVVACVLGGIFSGWTGVWGGLIGTAMAVIFTGLTAASILFANRFTASDLYVGIFFGAVLGTWILKFVLFLVLAFVFKGQPWVNPTVMFLSLIAAVIGSLTVDLIVAMRSRLPYASDVRLPSKEDEKP